MRRVATGCAFTGILVGAILVAGFGFWLSRLEARLTATHTPVITRPAFEGNATLAQLRQLPEANLIPAGSTVLQAIDAELSGFAARRNPSRAGYRMGTQATQEEVVAFYTQQLRNLGWPSPEPDSSTTVEENAWVWRKDKLVCRLSFAIQQSSMGTSTPVIRSYATVFEFVIRNQTNDGH